MIVSTGSFVRLLRKKDALLSISKVGYWIGKTGYRYAQSADTVSYLPRD